MVKVSRRGGKVIMVEDGVNMREPVGGIYTVKSTKYMNEEAAKAYVKRCRQAIKKIPDATITMVEMMTMNFN